MISKNNNNLTIIEKIFPYLIETIDDLIIITSLENSFKIEEIFECNFLDQLNYSKKNLLGKSLLNLFHYGNGVTEENFIQLLKQDNCKLDIQMIQKNRNLTWTELRSRKFYDEDDCDKVLIRLHDISEEKSMELKTKELEKFGESEWNYRFIFENANDLIRVTNSNFEIEYINKQVHERLLGYSDEGFYGRKILLLFHPEDKNKVISSLHKAQKQEIVTIQARLRHENGIYKWFEFTTKSFFDNTGDKKFLAIARDITDRKKIEQEIIKSKENYRNMINDLDVGFFRVSLDGIVIKYNRRFNEILGIPPSKDLIGTKTFDFWQNKDDRDKFIGELRKFGYAKNYVSKAKRIDGTEIILEGNSHIIKNDDGIPIATEGTITDITEKYHLEYIKKEAEEKLKESEIKYRSLFENMNAGFAYHKVIVDDNNKPIDYEYIEVNPAFEELTGTKRENLIGKKVTEAIPGTENDSADWIGKFGNVGLTGIPLTIEQYSEALNRWYKVSGYSPKLGYFAVTFTDITERKMAEEKFRTIAEQSLMGICIIQDFNIKYVNQQMADIYGYSLEEVSEWKPNEFIKVLHPESRNLALEQIKKKQQGSTNVIHHYIAKIITKNGNVKYVENYSKSITYQGRTADLLTQIDITSRMVAEQKVRESEEKYRNLFEKSPIALMDQDFSEMKKYIDDLKTTGINDFEKYLDENPEEVFNFMTKVKVVDVNQKILEVYKINNKDDFILRMNKLGENINEKMSEEIYSDNRREFLSLINGNKTYESEIATKTLSGENIYLYAKTAIVPGFEKTWKKVIVSLVDITDRKLAEQKLKISEEKYRYLFESSPHALLLINMEGIVIDCNFTSEKLSGFTRSELVGKSFANTSFIPKEYMYTVLKDFKTLLKNNIIEPREIQLYSKEGSQIWVSYQGSILSIEDEKVIQVIIEDIRERKKAEEELKDSEAKYHQLYETSPDGVILSDLRGKIIECNTAIESISGYSSKEFLGKNFIELELYQDDGLEKLKEGYKDLFGNNLLDAVELPIKSKNGSLKWVQISSTLFNMKRKSYILAVIHEITGIKQAEKVLKESEEKFRGILETSSVGIMEFDVINNKLVYINPKLLDIVGYIKEELTEKVFRNDLIHPKDLNKLLMTNEESELEFRITDKQGRLKWLSGKRVPHYNEEGKITSIRVWLDDITEKKMYENLIYELNINFLNFTADIRNNIDLLLNTCLKLLEGDMILYTYKSVSEEQEYFKMITSEKVNYNYNSEDFSQLFISALFYEEHDFPQTFFNIDQMNYAKTDPFIIEHKFKGSLGKVIKSHEGLTSAICIFYKNNPVISGQDKLVLFLICDALEIEQRRWQVQQDLEEQNITLNKINKLKSELFSRTSHELKTPLISVKGFTELLLTLYKSKLDPEIISILGEIKDGSKRLEEIINLLLESTKLEAGQLSLNLQDEDLTFLINFCVKELNGLTKLRNQSIILNLHSKLETKFDKERIYEVISNLLVNAIKYTPPGGNITIESKIENDLFEILVKDDGIGFTEEEKSLVFKQFGKIERYGQGWDVAADGTGLGLYITKKLVELHDGDIWFESEGRNRGTTFHFTIPIKK